MADLNVRIDYASHYPEWDEFRCQPGVWSALDQMANNIKTTAEANARASHPRLYDAEFAVWHGRGSKRARVYVGTGNYRSRIAEHKYNALTNALYAGAGIY